MKIIQKRYNYGGDFTLSMLYVDGDHFKPCGYILEDAVREIEGQDVRKWKIPGETAIPVGVYDVEKTWSGRWSKMMWELLNVPGYAGIRIHSGNTSKDTEGCLITGKERDNKHGEVSGSRVALEALNAKMEHAANMGERITWEVQGLGEQQRGLKDA